MEKIPHELIVTKLKERFGKDILRTEEEPLYKVLVVTINPARIVDLLRFLYEDKDLQFQFLTSLFAVHYPERKDEEIEMVYLVHSLWKNTRFRIKANLPISNPVIDSVTGLYAAANWMERETYDFFGVQFKGHPDLKRILNVDSMDYFPMRKEYPLEEGTRTDKDDTMFGRQSLVNKKESLQAKT
ncbi:MAG: NADH-quinone oxidoreductase subunit C [Chitinophagales bacterium]|nr:MAG: NADH-quinone oxidoreductase subunit C [Chitinophagales bacterium]